MENLRIPFAKSNVNFQLYTAAGYEVPPESDGSVFGQFLSQNPVPLPVGDSTAVAGVPLLTALTQLKSEVTKEQARVYEVTVQAEKNEPVIEMIQV